MLKFKKKGGADMKDFEKIKDQETNENTALILMMSILGDKLSRIIDLLEKSNKTSAEIFTWLKSEVAEEIEPKEKVKVFYMPLTPEDYD